ncbi:MAG: hypothetical protein BMS9Abin30_1026 [Gammaproteobacteria bacterium]|nr:MAG: hypothetical protein BMS9Abin30_1026 [Gammaproteobacteria bacterium]
MSRLIKIYGERNTNTNYLEKLIHLNLDAKQLPGVAPRYVKTIQKILPGKEWLRDLFFSVTRHRNLGWKHTCVMSASELRHYGVHKRDICFVSITKNPYSWLLSLYRKPYSHQYSGGGPDFETFLQTPWKTVARDNCENLLASPIALWNMKNAAYLRLGIFDGLNIMTESTFQNPESVIEKISHHFSIDRLSDNFLNYEKSTKDESKNFAYYRDYYVNERWREDLSARATSIIGKAVDRNLMRHFGYKVLGA